jgi:hypothetical protein
VARILGRFGHLKIVLNDIARPRQHRAGKHGRPDLRFGSGIAGAHVQGAGESAGLPSDEKTLECHQEHTRKNDHIPQEVDEPSPEGTLGINYGFGQP